IKLSSFPFSWRGNGKLQVHMILVKRLVLRETNIPVDPRKIRTGSAARIEIRIKFQCRGREFLQQAPERLNNGSLIAVAVHLHPLLAVVAAQVLEKLKRFAREHRHFRCHGASISYAVFCLKKKTYNNPTQRTT